MLSCISVHGNLNYDRIVLRTKYHKPVLKELSVEQSLSHMIRHCNKQSRFIIPQFVSMINYMLVSLTEYNTDILCFSHCVCFFNCHSTVTPCVLCMYIYIYIYVCTCIYKYIYIHIYIYMLPPPH